MMIYKQLLLLTVMPLIAACTGTDPVPFKIGKDGCDHCKMTIMSKNYGMETVTTKGKVYKFDDISCGVTFYKKQEADVKVYVIDFESGKFLESEKAIYLKSENNRTPMNSMIVAFSTSEAAKKVQKTKGGELLSWDAVKNLY